MAKTYPNTTFQHAAREAGFTTRLLWETKGVQHTQVAWISCYQVGATIAIVLTYADGNGWEVLNQAGLSTEDETMITDILLKARKA